MQAGPGQAEAGARGEAEGVLLWVVAMVLPLGVAPKEASPSVEVVSTYYHLCPAMEEGGAGASPSVAVGPLPGSVVEVQEHWGEAPA